MEGGVGAFQIVARIRRRVLRRYVRRTFFGLGFYSQNDAQHDYGTVKRLRDSRTYSIFGAQSFNLYLLFKKHYNRTDVSDACDSRVSDNLPVR